MKKDKALRAFKSAIKIQQNYGLDDSEMDQLVIPEMVRREKAYKKAVISRYGSKTYEAASKWFQSLSPREQRTAGSNAEQICQSYLDVDPDKKVSAHDLERAIGKDQYKAPIRDESNDELPPPDRDETGQLVPGKKIKLEKKTPQEPTQAELKKMSLQEIAQRIKEIRDYRWPSGGGGEEIAGLDGVGVEK